MTLLAGRHDFLLISNSYYELQNIIRNTMSTTDKVTKVRDRGIPRILTVKSVINITPNMRRVTLLVDPSENFPPNSEGAFMKMLFEQADKPKPIMRTYTLSQQRSELNEVDIDFMLHKGDDGTGHVSSHGIAAPWSLKAKPGDMIALFGPGPAKHINLEADCFILAADMTALPALSANLKLLPKDATGTAFIEVLSEADKQDLAKPENVELVWVVNDKPGSDESPLFHAIEQSDWKKGKLAVWSACEFKTMKKIRQYLKVNRDVERSHLYISSYWKKGNTEEEHKVVRQADKDNSQM